LFDLLDYKKEDFTRRGARKAWSTLRLKAVWTSASIAVYRDTGTGYYVYDIALKNRIADKKEEVTRFLWQHLGVEAGTDLESLFRRAIGVPQGRLRRFFSNRRPSAKRLSINF
jgi:DNA repair exonuclease SbcCD ATPase subunit